MTEELRYEWRRFGRTHWGPAHVVVRTDAVEATVGEATVALDLADRRPAAERQKDEFRSVFADGVPVSLDGRQVATITRAPGSPAGLIRRSRHEVTGDPSFVPPGLRFTDRGLPQLLTLRSDAGVLVATKRWGAPIDTVLWELSWFTPYGVVAPRVAPDTRPEHVALWLAMREAQRS